MADFRVVQVVDGDTFDVSPGWTWSGHQGTRVRPTGYDAPEFSAYAGATATRKLTELLLGQTVQLGSGHRVDRGRLVCDVYFRGRNLSDFFPEYR